MTYLDALQLKDEVARSVAHLVGDELVEAQLVREDHLVGHDYEVVGAELSELEDREGRVRSQSRG